MARPLKPLVKGGGYYPSNRWTPLVYRGGYTTANGGGEQPDPVEKTASGALVHITDALAAPVSALSVAIEPVQSGSGDPSPSNIRPISGWTGANVTMTGKNLLDQSKCIARKYVTISGNLGDSSDWCASDYTPIKGGQTYTVSGYAATGWAACHAFYDNNKDFISAVYAINHSTFTSPNNAVYVRLSIKSETPTVAQLELGSTASAYEPFSGETYSISFPTAAGTVYGGTLDVTTGKLTVDMAMADMGTLTWSGWEQGGSFIFYSHVPDKMPVRDIPCISSQYAYNSAITGSWSDLLNGELTGQFGGDNVYVRDARYSSIADFKTAMSGVQLVYPLDTPIEYTLTPTEVTTLLGENNIWADAGDVTVTYIADGNASDAEALGILLGGRYTPSDDVTDKEALDIILGGTE